MKKRKPNGHKEDFEFLVTAAKYKDSGDIGEVKSVLITVNAKYKVTAMKMARCGVLQELNKNCGKFIRDKFQYYSIC